MQTVVPEGLPNRYFLTIKEVSDYLGVSRSTINRQEKKNLFPKRQQICGRRVGYRKDLFLQLLNGNWSPNEVVQ